MVSVSVRCLFYQAMDEKIKTWPLRFPAKENLNMEKALFDWPIAYPSLLHGCQDTLFEPPPGQLSWKSVGLVSGSSWVQTRAGPSTRVFKKLVKSAWYLHFHPHPICLFAYFLFFASNSRTGTFFDFFLEGSSYRQSTVHQTTTCKSFDHVMYYFC